MIDMQMMRYLNLLNKVSHVRTNKCFIYNNTIIFAVSEEMMSRAIGIGGKNVRILENTFERKVKIIRENEGMYDAERFVRDIVEPIPFKSAEIKDNFFILNAGSKSKAVLIGRNKKRFLELEQIIKDVFGKELRII